MLRRLHLKQLVILSISLSWISVFYFSITPPSDITGITKAKTAVLSRQPTDHANSGTSNNLTEVQKSDWERVSDREQVFEKRRQHVRKACIRENSTDFQNTLHTLSPYIVIAENHSIAYCGIPKAGSTFWRKTINIIESRKYFSSLYDLRNSDTKPGQQLISLKNLLLQKNVDEDFIESFLKSSMSFIFVREPYGRLFSGYSNKLRNPNMLYWRDIGRVIIRDIRKQPTAKSLEYGHDVTFAELIQFLVKTFETGEETDRHFTPMYQRCDPCQLSYDYIGKMETFSEDATFIIEKLKQKYSDISIRFDEFDSETALDTAQSLIRFLFGVLEKTPKIRSEHHNFFLRIWRDLQIRGYLSKQIDMPFTAGQTPTITKEEFLGFIKEALTIPINKTDVKQQRTEALIQAYDSVPLDVMERLTKYVERDCLLFDYEVRPTILFDRHMRYRHDSFNYFDGL